MAKKKLRITQADFLLANRKAAREEEIRQHGHPVIFRSVTQKSKKVYDRKRLKKAGIKFNDDLPFSSYTVLAIVIAQTTFAPIDW